MARLDIHLGRLTGNLFLNVQADRLSHLKTRLVVPLSPVEDAPELLGSLHPVVMVAGKPMVLATHLAVAVQVADLGQVVANVADDDHRIVHAIDVLIGTA